MDTIIQDRTCCFVGHRNIVNTKKLKENLYKIVENLVTNERVNTFLFGSKSEFNNLCLKTVNELKEKYPHIKRIYVRAEFSYIDEDYRKYLLENYEDTYYPEQIKNSGKASYVKRNQEMINHSKFCVVYYDENYVPKTKTQNSLNSPPRSGTAIAYNYALKKDLAVINAFQCDN